MARQAGRANCHKFLLIQAQILNLLLLPTAAAAAVAVADHVAEIIIDVRRRRRKEERIGATRRIGEKRKRAREGKARFAFSGKINLRPAVELPINNTFPNCPAATFLLDSCRRQWQRSRKVQFRITIFCCFSRLGLRRRRKEREKISGPASIFRSKLQFKQMASPASCHTTQCAGWVISIL